MSTERKVYTDDELRAVCNDATPHDAFQILLSFAQRITIALEDLAGQVAEENKLLDTSKIRDTSAEIDRLARDEKF